MDTNKFVGEKIKELRESRSLSREELAAQSGIPVSQLERIETNADLPSLAPLIKIARVLGVRLGTLLDEEDENGPVVCRKGEVQNSITFSNNAIESRRHMVYHSLSRSKANRHMEPFFIDVTPTDNQEFVLSTHEGEEFILVMEGTMEITYGKYAYLLNEGDSIYYDSIVPHHVHAARPGEAAKILAVIYTPI
ncbi:MAG: XRE family transcriptional regulator [Prevotellaceae bacterium]|nr:XRE family transcriptional regulator [Prevotellaceae bacterium]